MDDQTKGRQMDTLKDRVVVVIGWDGRSNPIYCYRDELCLPDHLRSMVPLEERG